MRFGKDESRGPFPFIGPAIRFSCATFGFLITSGAMSGTIGRARALAAAWGRRPSRARAAALRKFYSARARELPLAVRGELCLALGEAEELEGRFEAARHLYALAVGAADPVRDEPFYTRAAARALLNASRLRDLAALSGVARVVETLGRGEETPRLLGLGAMARGLERLLEGDWTAARRAFEAAMGAAWESGDADAETLAHHLLAQAWVRLGRLARAREHVEAAQRAAARSGSWLLSRRMALEAVALNLRAGPTAAALAEARRLVAELRRTGFPRLESLAWHKIVRGMGPGRPQVEPLLARSEGLLPEGHPDRAFLAALRETPRLRRVIPRRDRAGIAAADGEEAGADPEVARQLRALVRMARF